MLPSANDSKVHRAVKEISNIFAFKLCNIGRETDANTLVD
jgi:hypothetical protein